ncbi:aspartic peptidase domain-containing protein [Xylariaceae sp. FL1272]|nr:aspartic peptidase domain-containing protein [Xylariaceae sp. FL1272]
MYRSSILQLSLWIASISALSTPAPTSHLETREGASPAAKGFVTFKLQKKALPRVAHNPRFHAPTKTDISARDNEYTIVTASTPTASRAAGVDQDGTDYSYFAEVEFGSNKTPLYMLLDTGASTTWVMGSMCESPSCTSHNTFGPDDSDSYEEMGKPYSIEYGTGSVEGTLVQDAVSLAGLTVTMSFGVANSTSDSFTQFPFDGIMGLTTGTNTWLSALLDAKLLDSNIFGIDLSRNSDGVNDGEIIFGSTNTDKYTGDISYTALKSQGSWIIPMDDVTVGGESSGVTGSSAYLDTGTSFIFGPPDDVKEMYKLIEGASSSDDGATYTIPCDSDAEVAFTFSGKSWAISSKDFMSKNGDTCTGNIYGIEYVPGGWLLGDTFLKNVYSVFDADNQQIGFASPVAASDSTSSSSASATGTSTTMSAPSSTAATTGTAAGVSATGSATQDNSSSRPVGGVAMLMVALLSMVVVF